MKTAGNRKYPRIAWLLLASLLFRGLVPAGLMPAGADAARHGALLVICTHGEMAQHGHGGQGSGGPSIEQCPFGAAAGAAVPGTKIVFSFPPGVAQAPPEWSAVLASGSAQRLQPPARAPPVFS